ncbi:MAG: hypothetical protein H6702_05705 [Myxococcales bacterium]|nr:hypothetical protein [Myxococcales bacterium]
MAHDPNQPWSTPDVVLAATTLLDGVDLEELLDSLATDLEGLRRRLAAVGETVSDGHRLSVELEVTEELFQQAQKDVDRLSRSTPSDRFLANPVNSMIDRPVSIPNGELRAAREFLVGGVGKLVVLRSDDGESRVRRLSTENYQPRRAHRFGLLSRNAALAGRIVSARLGQYLDLPNEEEEFEVVLIAELGRFRGAERQGNITNLRRVAIACQSGDRDYFDARKSKDAIAEHIEDALDAENLSDGLVGANLPEAFEPGAELVMDDRFYLNSTEAQEELMRRPPKGLSVVLGVAGSGKTSVALGRTKMLCDALEPEEGAAEDEYADLWIDHLDVAPENVVGFVLSPQLVPYLKGLADQLNLPRMQVRDYQDLRNDLWTHRTMRDGKALYTFTAEASAPVRRYLGTVRWLTCLQQLVRDHLVGVGLEVFRTPPSPKKPRTHAEETLAVVWADFWQEVSRIRESFSHMTGLLLLEGLLKQLEEARERLSRSLEEARRWLVDAGRYRPVDAVSIAQRASQAGEIVFRRQPSGSWSPLMAYRTGMPPVPVAAAEIDGMLNEGAILGMGATAGAVKRLEIIVSPWRGATRRSARQAVSSAVRERIVGLLRLDRLVAEAIKRAESGSLEPEARVALGELKVGIAMGALPEAIRDSILALAEIICAGYEGREGREPISHLTASSRYAHVFIDEFQDFTELQLFLMSEQAHPLARSVTAVGDFAQSLLEVSQQNTHSAGFIRSSQIERAPVFLADNKRQTPALAALSTAFRNWYLGDALPLTTDGLGAPDASIYLEAAVDDVLFHVVDDLSRRLSVAVICPDEALAKALHDRLALRFKEADRPTQVADYNKLLARFTVHFTTPIETKGLEFDVVVIPQVECFDLEDRRQANSLYVALSRPKSRLILIDGGSKSGWSAFQPFIDEGLLRVVEAE